MTKRRKYPLTRAEMEGRLFELNERLTVLVASLPANTSARREIAGVKAAIHIIDRTIRERYPDANS